MEKELDKVAAGELEWVPLLRAFYGPFRELVDVKRKELKRADFTTEATDEVCSEGHPMVIRLGKNGRFLACSQYPEHKESRPLPGEEPEPIAAEGAGQPCPGCGEGTLVAKRGRFGAFAGCDRYPTCSYIHRTGPPPPAQLPFEVTCPGCRSGHFVARRARRTGSVFWGCSRYPECRATSRSGRSTMRMTDRSRRVPPAASVSPVARACRSPRPSRPARAWRAGRPIPRRSVAAVGVPGRVVRLAVAPGARARLHGVAALRPVAGARRAVADPAPATARLDDGSPVRGRAG
jgi:ssDNA-binding Zn-finger/Zn-ribbon topoisomerase 1